MASCPSGWFIGPNKVKCFGYFAKSQSWDDSETQCKNFSGRLAAVTSFEELSIVRKLCSDGASGCWIGGRFINTTVSMGWKWSDNKSFWNESIISEQPVSSICPNLSCHNSSLFGLCTLVTNDTTSVVAEQCNSPHAFLCMLDIGM